MVAVMEAMQRAPEMATTGFKQVSKGLKKSTGKTYRTSTSKYTPHQGKQECARRIRQIKSGQLQRC